MELDLDIVDYLQVIKVIQKIFLLRNVFISYLNLFLLIIYEVS